MEAPSATSQIKRTFARFFTQNLKAGKTFREICLGQMKGVQKAVGNYFIERGHLERLVYLFENNRSWDAQSSIRRQEYLIDLNKFLARFRPQFYSRFPDRSHSIFVATMRLFDMVETVVFSMDVRFAGNLIQQLEKLEKSSKRVASQLGGDHPLKFKRLSVKMDGAGTSGVNVAIKKTKK
ncbi:unnamed protein product [Caenorhabditis angaria]|uniref:Uncharacterized protein n=1 Tax=Caenorhabditis angaria TaxID=860376 RepID=A0A9P1J6J6_9PELO|nr:unnamed protein product [Caenorhabditis angaria]